VQQASAERTLPAHCVIGNEQISVRLRVTLGASPPSGLILKEILPAGWVVLAATWNGVTHDPYKIVGSTNDWLFGVDVPVGTGVLSYVTQAVAPPGQSRSFAGHVAYKAGSNVTVQTTGNMVIGMCPAADLDGDGIPNAWETQHGLNPTNRNDAGGNGDGDPLTNFGEYIADTNPTNTASCFALIGVSVTGGHAVVRWKGGTQVTQKLYRASTPALDSGRVCILTNRPPTSVTNAFTDQAPVSPGGVFYRLEASR
jgi:hypothetical protein